MAEKIAEVISFVVGCLFSAALCIGMTLFVRWLFSSWWWGGMAGLFMAFDAFLLLMTGKSPLSGKRWE